jgi:hypothetical protein
MEEATRALRRAELAVASAQSAADAMLLLPIRVKDRDGAIQRARTALTAAKERQAKLVEGLQRPVPSNF